MRHLIPEILEDKDLSAMFNKAAALRQQPCTHSRYSTVLTLVRPSETLRTSFGDTLAHELGSSPMASAKHIVFVVDDDVWVRESLETLIQDEGWHAETFASAQEFLDRPRDLVPSCLLLDISLPGLNGLELQKRIAVERVDIPIIFITGHGDVPKTVQAMKAGAVEFLTKPFNDEVLLTAIRQALERSRLALAQESDMQDLRECYASLTPRERDVMALVVSGLLNKQVAGELGITESTVKAHRGQVMQKMKANSVADLVKMTARLHQSAAPRQSVSSG